MPQLQQTRELYPTKLQREKTLDIDSELLELLNRSRDSDWFVARDIETWALRLHLWLPECSDTPMRESFVSERISAFLRMGVLNRAGQVFEDGVRVAGFIILARRGETKLPSKWSPKDTEFLRDCGISPTDDTREPLNSRGVTAKTKNDLQDHPEEIREQLAMAHQLDSARRPYGDDSETVTAGK